jgi:hypothetical protein
MVMMITESDAAAAFGVDSADCSIVALSVEGPSKAVMVTFVESEVDAGPITHSFTAKFGARILHRLALALSRAWIVQEPRDFSLCSSGMCGCSRARVLSSLLPIMGCLALMGTNESHSQIDFRMFVDVFDVCETRVRTQLTATDNFI